MTGDGRFHAILGGGPSYIVHPSDTAPALVALGAQIKIVGRQARRLSRWRSFLFCRRWIAVGKIFSALVRSSRGKRLDNATAKQAGELALDGAKPLRDNIYKVKIAQDLIQRGLLASV